GAASPGGPDNVVTDLVALQSLDQYGNSISNQNIQFTLTGSGDGSNGLLLGVCNGNCIGPSITLATGVLGASANVSLGTASTYTLNAVGGTGSYTTNYKLQATPGLQISTPFLQDELGHNIFAAKVRSQAGFSLTAGFFNYDSKAHTYTPCLSITSRRRSITAARSRR